MKQTSLVFFSALLILALVAGINCKNPAESVAKKAAEKTLEAASGGKAKVDLGSGGNIDLSGLPATMHYPGAKAISRFSLSGEEGKGASYVFETSDPASTIIAWYRKSLTGWKEQATMETADGNMVAFTEPGEKRNVLITIGKNKDKGNTTLALVYAEK